MATLNQNEILKKMATESVKQGENLRDAIRSITLQALQSRELTLTQIKQVIRSVTEGVNLGAAGAKIDPEKALSQAFDGMDDALLKAARANHLALQQLTGAGREFEDSQLNKALGDLEHLEDEFLKTIKQASDSASDRIKQQWAEVLKQAKPGQTDTGQEVAAMMEEYGKRSQTAFRESRAASLKTAHALTQNFATLASGVLIGLSEALQQKGGTEGKKRGS